jgi:deoxyribodipyrimidine photo-lyase
MARDQRVHDNHALAAAQRQAIASGVPLAVVFCLLPQTGQRAQEHYRFMIEGLREVEAELEQYNIPFMMVIGDPLQRLGGVLHHLKPIAVYFDMSPLRGPRKLHQAIADAAECAIYEVDTHNVVPVWQASDHQEIGARTLRPKVNRLMPDYLDPAPELQKQVIEWPGTIKSLEWLNSRIDEVVEAIPANHTDISRIIPGEKAAQATLQDFVESRLEGYADNRNDPTVDGQSELSPYLHYGQLSAAMVVRAVLQAAGDNPSLQPDADRLIEELVVRKELSDNFCWYNGNYDSLKGVPEWAQRSLQKHVEDPRQFSYTLEEFKNAQTHDLAWNAAQLQLIKSGKIHGYMRMYWAKKVLEWSSTPEEALQTLLYLNDFYHLDGGDPNGYVGILWSIAGLHDRPWGERPVYGVVRSMVYTGLKRKFDIKKYEDNWL